MVFETIGHFMSKLMFFHGFVNECNGFPKPLSKEEEDFYIDKMESGDKSAREKLINHNLRLVAHVCKKYNGAFEADDLISVGSIGLIKGIDSFKKEKGSQLSTYVSRCIENEILMLLRANKKHKICVSIEDPIGCDKDGQELSLFDIIPQDEEDDPSNIVEKKVLIDSNIHAAETSNTNMILKYMIDLVNEYESDENDIMDLYAQMKNTG